VAILFNHPAKRDPRYDRKVSERNDHERSNRWQRRERRKQAERRRIKKHGAALRRVYRDAVLKRLKRR
jgi:hypothetical protein